MKAPIVTLNSAGKYWQARYIDPWTGDEVKKGIGSKAKITPRRAREKCQRLAVEVMKRGPVDDSPVLCLQEWCDKYLTLRTDLKPGTVELYETAIAYLVEYIGADTPIDTITSMTAAEWRADLRDRGLSEQTIRKHVRHAKAIFGDRHGAVRHKLIAESPFADEASAPPKVANDWSYVPESDIETLIEAATSWDMRCLIALTRYAGMRPNEVRRLRWSDVNWSEHKLSIWPDRSDEGSMAVGTKQGQRICPIRPRLHRLLLDAFEAAPDGAEYVVQIKKGSMYAALKKVCADAAVPYPADPYKTFRKNLRSDWAAEGIGPDDLSKFLGHDKDVSFEHYHQTKSETWARLTGVGGELSEVDQLKAEREILRRRCRRLIRLARSRIRPES